MSQSPWDVLSAAITRLSDRFNDVPSIREATVSSLGPLSVLFDTDTEPTLVQGTLADSLQMGERVLTVKIRHYVWVLGYKTKGQGNYPDLSTQHLDTVTQRGTYVQGTVVNGTTANGYPRNGVSGLLEVFNWQDGAHIYQRFTERPNGQPRMWVRGKYTSQAWQPWFEIVEDTFSGQLLILNANDASLTSTNHALQIGASNGQNLRADNNEIMAVANGAASPLGLNSDGGNINLGHSSSTINVPGLINSAYTAQRVAQGTATSQGSTVVNVTFPASRFTVAPRVYAQFQSGQSIVSVTWVTGITATGFELRAYNLGGTGSSGGVLAWWAVQMGTAANG